MAQLRELRVEHVSGVIPEWVPLFEEVYNQLLRKYRPDGREVVEWMVEAETYNRILEVTMQSYGDAGGVLDWHTGDGNIPGVSYYYGGVRYRFRREDGRVVANRRYAFVDPGSVRVPLHGWAWVRFPRVLGAVPWAGWIQYTAILAVFHRFARLPVRSRVAFANARGIILPLVFEDRFTVPPPAATYALTVSVDRESRLVLVWHHGGTATEASVDLSPGTNLVAATLLFPSPSGYLELRLSGARRASVERIERVPPV